MTPDIELHIEELVLHGLPARDSQRIAELLPAEFGRLVAESEPPAIARDARAMTAIGSLERYPDVLARATVNEIVLTVRRSIGSGPSHAR